MNPDPTARAERRRIGGGLLLILAPLLLLTSTLSPLPGQYWDQGVGKLAFVLFIGAILALVHLLSPRADRTALVGGALAIAGAVTGSSLLTAGLYEWALRGGDVPPEVAEVAAPALDELGLYLFTVWVPAVGLAFPIGLLILAIGLLVHRVVPTRWAALLMIGAVLFPAGRIPKSETLSLACDATLTVALGAIGLLVLRSRELWSRDASAVVAVETVADR